ETVQFPSASGPWASTPSTNPPSCLSCMGPASPNAHAELIAAAPDNKAERQAIFASFIQSSNNWVGEHRRLSNLEVSRPLIQWAAPVFQRHYQRCCHQPCAHQPAGRRVDHLEADSYGRELNHPPSNAGDQRRADADV